MLSFAFCTCCCCTHGSVPGVAEGIGCLCWVLVCRPIDLYYTYSLSLGRSVTGRRHGVGDGGVVHISFFLCTSRSVT